MAKHSGISSQRHIGSLLKGLPIWVTKTTKERCNKKRGGRSDARYISCPVSDLRRSVVTPALLLLGQEIAQCPVRTVQDVVTGLICSGIMFEYSRERKCIDPKMISMIAGVIRLLFAEDVYSALESMPIPDLASSVIHSKVIFLRDQASKIGEDFKEVHMGKVALIIEETRSDIEIKYGQAVKARKQGILSFCMAGLIDTVHIIYPTSIQCYHGFGFHKNPHYGLKVEHIPLIKWIISSMGVACKEYKADKTYHHNSFLTIQNNMIEDRFPFQELYRCLKRCRMKSRNLSNYYISYGYSAMFREANGPPLLTRAIESKMRSKEKMLPLLLPILCNLSKDLKAHYNHIAPDIQRNMQYSQLMGSNFGYNLTDINYFEGLDCSILYSDSLLRPHCDVMNDWRKGYDYLSVVKSTFWDGKIGTMVTLSIICYTRKAVGDYKYGCGQNTYYL